MYKGRGERIATTLRGLAMTGIGAFGYITSAIMQTGLSSDAHSAPVCRQNTGKWKYVVVTPKKIHPAD